LRIVKATLKTLNHPFLIGMIFFFVVPDVLYAYLPEVRGFSYAVMFVGLFVLVIVASLFVDEWLKKLE
jgi:hypothetical protein